MSNAELMRIRTEFSKNEPMRFTGHLDLFRSWERTFRRSGLPLAYSQGFHPQPRLNLACALPLGFTSECELIDAWLECVIDLAHIKMAIEAVLPPGLMIHGIDHIELHAPALQTQVTSAIYLIKFLDHIPDLFERIERIILSDHIYRTRRGKSYDLHPLIEEISLIPESDHETQMLRIRLSVRESATGRPEEVLDEMGIKFENTHVHREELLLQNQ
jgi:radical SAM-linked protein